MAHFTLSDRPKHEDVQTGDTIDVMIEGKVYTTVIDEHGTQRFPKNSVLDYMFYHDTRGRKIDHSNPAQMHTQMLNLNTLTIAFQQGKFDKREWMEIIMQGYSVSGFCDLCEFQDWSIQNPLWGEIEDEDQATV